MGKAVSWPVPFPEGRIDLFVRGRIGEADARRQLATAREVLARLGDRPGLVLADEVGMGKTFVALSVAASVAWADRQSRPVVVMVPPALREKWPRDFEVFRERCLGKEFADTLRKGVATSAVEFFRLLDDPPARRAHVIFLSHGALHNGLQDPWVKLAILKRALASSRLEQQRQVFPRFASELLLRKSKAGEDSLYRALLQSPTHAWRSVLIEHEVPCHDDPIPEAIETVLASDAVGLGTVREQLLNLPLRASDSLRERLTDTRRALVNAMQQVWVQALKAASFRSPLLILDEAHHVKNPATRLASLFVGDDAESDSQLLGGALAGRFERMLFLTATPFQLGHHELLHVLDRFQGIAWRHTTIGMAESQFLPRLEELRRALDAAQCAAVALDTKWRLVVADDVEGDPEHPDDLEAWWKRVADQPGQQPERIQVVWRAYEGAGAAMREAASALRPWVIRHLRPRMLPARGVSRRNVLPGEAILTERADGARGLGIRDESVLPFLLATRCQTIVTRLGENSRAVAGRITFAEGLASSYEAFRETRALAGQRDGAAMAVEDDGDGVAAVVPASQRLDWYFTRLDGALPTPSAYAQHPKVAPTVQRALELWRTGEKVLVFCHFRQTGRALVRHLSEALQAELTSAAAAALGCPVREVGKRLQSLGDRFERGRQFHAQLYDAVEDMTRKARGLSGEERERVFEVVRRFVRTPSFLARYFPLGTAESADLLEQALERPDGSGLSLRAKIEAFSRFVVERCSADERVRYLDALEGIETGRRRGGVGDEDEGYARQPNVRLANGATGTDERQRLMLAFNAPFFPEILVASSVLAEGVDLHLDCRHVIHHDLCWNPSTLEQRTGRVDRIGAKAEKVGQSIRVYLPYIAGTQDEKMFRVVRDRERWFQVLMGEDYVVDEALTEKLARRVPLPETAAKGLAMRLEVT